MHFTNAIRRLLCAILVCSLASRTATAQSAGACPNESAIRLCYATDVIEALSFAHTASLTRPDTIGVSGSLVGMGAALLYVSGRQRTGIEQAIRVLRPYLSVRDTIVSSNATELAQSLLELRAYSLAADSSLRATLDGRAGSPSAQAQRSADLQNRRHSAASMLVLSTIGVTYTLLEQDPSNPARTRLLIRASERDDLRARLRQRFGDALAPVLATGQYSTDFAAAAKMLGEFLSQDWTTRP